MNYDLIPHMTLGNMRSLGVRSVAVSCGCGHEAVVNVDALDDDAHAVPSIRERLRCSSFGSRADTTRPDWTAYRPSGSGAG